VQFDTNVVTNNLRVGTNTVTLRPVGSGGTYTVANPVNSGADPGIVVGELAGETAVLNSYLSTFSATVMFLGKAAGSSGTLNLLSGTLSMNGTGAYLVAGTGGSGIINVSNGAAANVATVSLGLNSASTGLCTVDGSGSILQAGTLYAGSFYGGNGSLSITNSGQVNAQTAYCGNGNIEVTNGGQVNAQTAYLGAYSGPASLTVDGPGSKFTTPGIYILPITAG